MSSDFVFDGLGRMVTVDGLGYQYDGLGRVAARSDGNAGWVGFAYSGTGLQPVSDGNGLIARSPGGAPVATKVGSAAAVSVGLDRHGDVVSTFDPVAGTVEGSVEFDPFGVVTGSGGVSAGNIGFQGAYTDPVSKLVDMGARWYSPGMGRFVSRDTIRPLLGTPVSLNMYTYANNDPLGHFDPDGHCAARIDGEYCLSAFKSQRAVTSKRLPSGHTSNTPARPRYTCTRHCPDGETFGAKTPPHTPSGAASQEPPDPIEVCAYTSTCTAKRMIELINASKEAGLGAAVFAAIEGADVDGELDGNWGQKSIDAAARGGADLVYAISNAFGENIKVADVRGLAALAQKVAQKLQHSTDDFEKIDHERTRLERLKSFAISALGPLVTVLVTGLCLSVVGAAATASMGAAAVAGAGCGTIGGAAGRFADGLNRTGSVEVAFDAALDGERMAYDAAAGLAGGALGYASMPKAPFGATKTSGQPVPSSTRPPAPATNTADDFANWGGELVDDAIRAPVTRPDFANMSTKIQRQMQTRGWTPELVDEAVLSGTNYPAVNKLGGANTPATRYVSPTTGQSVVIDNATGEIIQVGGPGFKYGVP